MAKTIGQLVTTAPATALSVLDYFEVEQGGNSAGATGQQLLTFTNSLSCPRGYIDGFICSNAADTANDITISPGMAKDSTNVTSLVLSSAITKRIDTTWSVGTDAGGMDTGSVASSQTYYIWAIKKDLDDSVDALFSLSKTAPSMPGGYTYKRRIMSIMTSTVPSIINFIQDQDRVIFNQPIINRASSALANTDRNGYATSVPPNMEGIININALNNASTAEYYLWHGNSSRIDVAASATYFDMFLRIGAVPMNNIAIIKVDSSSLMYIRGNTTNIYLHIQTLGWIDDRGQNQ